MQDDEITCGNYLKKTKPNKTMNNQDPMNQANPTRNELLVMLEASIFFHIFILLGSQKRVKPMINSTKVTLT